MKNFNKKNLLFFIIFLGILDFPIPINNNSEYNTTIEAGINGNEILKLIQKGWKSIKGCTRIKSKPITPNPIIPPKQISQLPNIVLATEYLSKNISKIKTSEDILPKIEEYLAQTKPNEGSVKTITCLKKDAEQILILREKGNPIPIQKKILNSSIKAINVCEYDIHTMQEYYFVGPDNLEYVQFIIPRMPTYVLNGKYSNRVFECRIFNIPKDINGNWLKFKEYLIRFFDDLLNRPELLWDEAKFKSGLSKINIDYRDINEIEQYVFAHIPYSKSKISNETFKSFKFIQQEIA